MIKRISLFILLLSAPLLADDCYSPCEITVPARHCHDCGGFYFTGEFLYFQTYEDDLTYTSIVTTVSPSFIPTDLFKEEFEEIDFDWDPGVRLGVGYNFPCDGWDLYVDWMYISTSPTASITLDEPSLSLIQVTDPDNATDKELFGCSTSAKTKWEMTLNAVDLELGRHYCTGCILSVRPFIGLKFAWIDQSVNTFYGDIYLFEFGMQTDFVGDSRFKGSGDFWGIGPRFGVDTHWELGCGFAIFGDLSGALLSGSFDMKGEIISENPTLDPSHVVQKISRSSRARIRTEAEIKVGIEWTTCFCDCYLFNASLGYEFQCYWRQLQIPIPAVPFSHADLQLHGLVAGLRFDF